MGEKGEEKVVPGVRVALALQINRGLCFLPPQDVFGTEFTVHVKWDCQGPGAEQGLTLLIPFHVVFVFRIVSLCPQQYSFLILTFCLWGCGVVPVNMTGVAFRIPSKTN